MLTVVSSRGFYFIFYGKPGGNTHKQRNACYCFCGFSPICGEMGAKTGETDSRQFWIVSLLSLTAGSSSAFAYLPRVVGIEHSPSRMLGKCFTTKPHAR